MSYQATIHIEPPVTDEILLIVESSIGAEESGEWFCLAVVRSAHVIRLTIRFLVNLGDEQEGSN